ncbi:unnamed protein product [Arabidopsis thaliana]|uniref:(thale cress) hypothetical protein n=1 Tax=Arabidopsis thaliana TaxID=3702 RepID=A0A7G2E7W9_ARATH|nr:unnamed protein product [Arabidopsis thaliana]
MARTKNTCVPLAAASATKVVVSQTINDEVVVASAAEVDSETTNSISNDDRAMFGPGATVQYLDVENKLLSMKKPPDARLRVAVLYFLCSVIVGKGKTGPNAPNVEKFFLRVVADLELCKTFPWGRFAFEENYLAFEAIPVLRENFCEDIESADPQFPRMCKMKFKSNTMKGFPMSDVYDKLGTTKDIQSILAPTPDEKLLLERIMDKECGVNDVDDLIADGWKKRLVDEERTICFEPLFNEDVAHRSFVANKAPSTVVKAPRKAVVEKKGKGKAAAALTSPSDEEVPQDAKVAEPSKKRGKAHEDGDGPSEEGVKKPKVVKKLVESRTDAKPVYQSPIQTRYRRKKTKKNV